ncbi:MAG TPA: amidohydrolase [Steroidobacteraceae bacterium]|nr:amidohydrolase [Steroidobacteraceae bacterium]
MKSLAALACTLLVAPLLEAQTLPPAVASESASLLATYEDLHAHPELSHHEARTSAILARGLRAAGYSVTERVGVYPDGSQAFGVVGILRNGAGKTLLIRGDMDALPIIEETGLTYASHVTTRNAGGQEIGVMHACGHDVHTTVLLGTARALAANRGAWRGTVMIIGQPSEETIDGAKAMLADHLYERFGRPDMIVGLHDTNTLAAGQVGIIAGPQLASSTSIDVVIKGIGGHGSAPQVGRDPVTLAAYYVTQIQTIVSREEDPQDPSVVTVGSIHGGTKRNIIPDEVKLELTTRSFSDESRRLIIAGLKQMAAGLAVAANLPPEKAATVTVLDNESTPVQYNDPALTARVHELLVKALGADRVRPAERIMGSEDVGVFGMSADLRQSVIPVVYFRLGAMDPAKLAAAEAAGKRLPGPHTSRFEPLPQPTLETGVTAMSAVATGLLQ